MNAAPNFELAVDNIVTTAIPLELDISLSSLANKFMCDVTVRLNGDEMKVTMPLLVFFAEMLGSIVQCYLLRVRSTLCVDSTPFASIEFTGNYFYIEYHKGPDRFVISVEPETVLNEAIKLSRLTKIQLQSCDDFVRIFEFLKKDRSFEGTVLRYLVS